jgi:hypothetical protein
MPPARKLPLAYRLGESVCPARRIVADALIMPAKHANTAWQTASDNSLDTRTLYVQNWKGDVTAVLDVEGKPLERVRYTAFGTPSVHPIADVDGNGKVEAGDVTKYLAHQGGGANDTIYTTTDLNADGLFPDDADLIFFDAEYVRLTNNGATTRTFGMNSVSGVGNREGFGGGEWDAVARGWMDNGAFLESDSGKWNSVNMVNARILSNAVSSPYRVNAAPNPLVLLVLSNATENDAMPPWPNPSWPTTDQEFLVGVDYDNSRRCRRICESCGGCAGYTPPGERPCVCLQNIEGWLDYPPGGTFGPGHSPHDRKQALEILKTCVAIHEYWHFINKGQGSPSCDELIGYAAESGCLGVAEGNCTTEGCRDLVRARKAEIDRKLKCWMNNCVHDITHKKDEWRRADCHGA